MEMRTGNTAPMSATSQTASEAVMAMNEDQFEREKLYQATMNMFRSMLKKGLITEEHIVGSIGDVINGTAPARGSDDEITLFDALGLAVEDVMCGKYLVVGA